MAGIVLPELAASDEEAASRYQQTKSADPFPEISSALLNTADMLDYIAATGMVHPFEVDPQRPEDALKPASCAIPMGGEWLYWPPTDKSDVGGCSGVLEAGEELWLEPNSIVYVTLAPRFRIPDYIAARYNLRIKQIYRGILVGTGPLVDPGFDGFLSVPLHNLTSNPYPIIGGEPLVWMEFTKLSPNERWTPGFVSGSERRGMYVEFPTHKLERRAVRDYVRHAHAGPIRSSIPEETERATQAATHATQAAERAEEEVRRFRKRSGWAVVGVVVAAITLVVAISTLTYQALDFVNGATDDQEALREDVTELRQKLSRQPGAD